MRPWICLWGRRHQKFPHNRSYSLSARVWWKWRIFWHIIKERWKVPCVLQVGISITDTNLQVDLILVRDTQLTLKSFQNVLMNLDCRDWSVQMGNYLIIIRQYRPKYLNLRERCWETLSTVVNEMFAMKVPGSHHLVQAGHLLPLPDQHH